MTEFRQTRHSVRALGFVMPLLLVACATAVRQEFDDDEHGSANPNTGGMTAGGKTSSTGGKTGSSSSGSVGSGPKAFGGTSTSGGTGNAEAGDTGAGGDDSGGKTSGGTGGQTSAGSAGKAGSGGSGGSGGSPVGTGSCSSTELFVVGPSTKYAKDTKVASVCNGGTPCTRAQPAAQNGKSYEFNCLDGYNCGNQDPGTTNWDQPPWVMTKACE